MENVVCPDFENCIVLSEKVDLRSGKIGIEQNNLNCLEES